MVFLLRVARSLKGRFNFVSQLQSRASRAIAKCLEKLRDKVEAETSAAISSLTRFLLECCSHSPALKAENQ